MRARKGAPRAKFPVCDDMTDAGDSSDLETPPPVTPPATPMRKQTFDNSRTAPANKPTVGFPFNCPSPPASGQKKGRKHRRSPSEGVFNMSLSSDEDVAGSGQALLSFARSRAQQKPPATPSPSFSRATSAPFLEGVRGEKPANFYASSIFQNSPSPDELPDPSSF
jgi:hypothetical protein